VVFKKDSKAMTAGGARVGAGRPKKPIEAKVAAALGTLVEMAIGQSSVSLELDSKGAAKPCVSVYHPDVRAAGRICEAEFDRLMGKYHPKPTTIPAGMDAFSDADLKLLGLQRVESEPKK
jgi:hypothetical protein